jgi:hypothetical protein
LNIGKKRAAFKWLEIGNQFAKKKSTNLKKIKLTHPLDPPLKLWTQNRVCGKEAVFDLAVRMGLVFRRAKYIYARERKHGAGHFHSSQRQVLLLLTHTIRSSFSHRCNQTQAKNRIELN